jgi:hypothetical protein
MDGFGLARPNAGGGLVSPSRGFVVRPTQIAVLGNSRSCDRFSMCSGVFEAAATVGYNPLDSSQGLS